jgi:hypothetical protein
LPSSHLGAANVFEKLCALDVRSATSFPKADHLLSLICSKAKGLQLRFPRCSVFCSLCSLYASVLCGLCCLHSAKLSSLNPLNASEFSCLSRLNTAGLINANALSSRHLLSLSFLNPRSFCSLSCLDAGLLLNIDALNTSQLGGAGLLNASCFPNANTLRPGKFCCLSLLACHFCCSVLTEHLCRLLKCLLRSRGLNARETIHQIALCQRFLNRLTRTTKGTSANSLSCTSATLFTELLDCAARLLIDHGLHVR